MTGVQTCALPISLDRAVFSRGIFPAVDPLTSFSRLLDPQVVDKVVSVFRSTECDYACNVLVPTYPDGLDTEVMTHTALERAWREARLKSEREHVTLYVRNHPELFRLVNVEHDEDLSKLRWTVDEPRDLEFVRALLSRPGAELFSLKETLALLRQDASLAQMNAGIERNEGLAKSLQQDAVVAQGVKT